MEASPATGPVRKRKDRDAAAPAAGPPDPAAGGNRLLAGLLAHEFPLVRHGPRRAARSRTRALPGGGRDLALAVRGRGRAGAARHGPRAWGGQPHAARHVGREVNLDGAPAAGRVVPFSILPILLFCSPRSSAVILCERC